VTALTRCEKSSEFVRNRGDKPKVKEKEGCEKATGHDGHRSGHVENVPEEKGGPSSKDGIR
jgi:hypothetical protein